MPRKRRTASDRATTPGIVDGDHTERDEGSSQRRDRGRQLIRGGSRHDLRHEPGGGLVEDARRHTRQVAPDLTPGGITSGRIDAGGGQRCEARPERVMVVSPQGDPAAGRHRLERIGGRPAAPPVGLPAVAEEPGGGLGQPSMGGSDPGEPRLEGGLGGQVDLPGRDRCVGQVEMGIGEPGDRHLCRFEREGPGPRPDERVELGAAPGGDDPPVGDGDRLDPAEAGRTVEAGDPPADDQLGRRTGPGPAHDPSPGTPVGPAM